MPHRPKQNVGPPIGFAGAMKFETKAIHAGQEPDPETHNGSVIVPIYQTSNFVQREPDKPGDFTYSRTGNPTRAALEACLASLEEARFGFAFASGMAAEDAVLRLLRPGDHVVLPSELYGGTRKLFDQVLAEWGIEFSSVDMTSAGAVGEALRPNTKMVWVETPSNPQLQVVDIQAAAEAAHSNQALLVADNTFATPYLQRPLVLGADVVVHSTTKYLSGHSDVIGGAVCTSDAPIGERLSLLQRTMGAVQGPFDSWLVLRGLKTLALRMRRHCDNAEQIAGWLQAHPAVEEVLYPGLSEHPQHEVAARQMDGFGGIVAVKLRSAAAAKGVASRTRLFCLAESLGGVESLVGYPALMSHKAQAGGEFAISDCVVRLSVGIENPDDLIEDLDQALRD